MVLASFCSSSVTSLAVDQGRRVRIMSRIETEECDDGFYLVSIAIVDVEISPLFLRNPL